MTRTETGSQDVATGRLVSDLAKNSVCVVVGRGGFEREEGVRKWRE